MKVAISKVYPKVKMLPLSIVHYENECGVNILFDKKSALMNQVISVQYHFILSVKDNNNGRWWLNQTIKKILSHVYLKQIISHNNDIENALKCSKLFITTWNFNKSSPNRHKSLKHRYLQVPTYIKYTLL